jgi:adenylosuccinate lyase
MRGGLKGSERCARVDPTCVLDYRYGRDEMRAIFGADAYLRALLEVEATLAKEQEALGLIPKGHGTAIRKAIPKVSRDRVEAIEAEIRHDIMAVAKALAEQAGDAGRSVHFGATSYDIVDTARALQHRDALALVADGVDALIAALAGQAREHRDLVMLGRTHGQWATPVTFGLKMAVFAAEAARQRERLAELRPRLETGKLLGATGSGAALHPHTLELQDRVMARLSLNAPLATTQILGRDRLAELVQWGGNLATSIEKFTLEIRNLQRSDIGEAAEAFDTVKQVGSSTMAQKQNPIACENLGGLARMVRSFAAPALENNLQWHERDLANSSSERMLLPHFYILIDEMLCKAVEVFRNVQPNQERIAANLATAGGLPMAEAVLLALARAGMDRQAAHELVRQVSIRAATGEASFRDLLLAEGKIAKLMTAAEIDAALDPANYVGHAGEIVDRVLASLA